MVEAVPAPFAVATPVAVEVTDVLATAEIVIRPKPVAATATPVSAPSSTKGAVPKAPNPNSEPLLLVVLQEAVPTATRNATPGAVAEDVTVDDAVPAPIASPCPAAVAVTVVVAEPAPVARP